MGRSMELIDRYDYAGLSTAKIHCYSAVSRRSVEEES